VIALSARPFAMSTRRHARCRRRAAFERALRDRIAQSRPAVIAEIKKASPSKGVLRRVVRSACHCASYERAGAACLSVLTDKPFFQGAAGVSRAGARCVRAAALRKEFIVDEYQVAESRALGADAILSSPPRSRTRRWPRSNACAHDYGMDVLVEVHDAASLRARWSCRPSSSASTIATCAISALRSTRRSICCHASRPTGWS
jgi:indole-3-glycerol phosphate synthase